MKASIIIPTYNRSDQLFRCMNSLVNLDFSVDEYEIIVVDNGSTDKTKEVVDKYKNEYSGHNIRYFYDDTPGLLTGRHLGAKEARSDILVFVDDDIHVDKSWLVAIVETFDRFPNVHLVGGKCLPKYETEPPKWLEYFWNYLPGGGKMLPELSLCDFGDDEKEISHRFIWGLNYSIRKKSLYELGGFHPDCISSQFQHFQGDGESGLSAKALKKGYKAFYQPRAFVYHEVPSERMTLGYFDKRYFYQGICNSYTEIRSHNGIVSLVSLPNLKRKTITIISFAYRKVFPRPDVTLQSKNNFEKEMLLTRFCVMEKAGYDFHQTAVRKSSVIRDWVLKNDYWDYSIPGYKSNEISN